MKTGIAIIISILTYTFVMNIWHWNEREILGLILLGVAFLYWKI